MSAASIHAALDARLLADQGGIIDIAWSGVFYSPQQGTPYLAASMQSQTRRPLGAGALGVVEWVGSYQVLVNYPIGEGVTPVLEKVQEISALFRRGTTLTTTDGWMVLLETPDTPPPYQQPNWISAPVSVRWTVYEKPAP